jgi:hypothetical protein
MKDTIMAIVQAPAELEPVSQLEAKYNRLTNDLQRQEFIAIIKELALTGTIDQKFVTLTIIEFLKKAHEAKEVVEKNIKSIDLKKDKKLIPSLLALAAALSTDWSIQFIENVISVSKPKANEKVYDYVIGIRTLITTQYWRNALNHIKWTVKNYDDNYVIDFLAFFKWKRTKADVDDLYQQLNDDPTIFKRISQLGSQIDFRYKNHYLRLIEKNERIGSITHKGCD